MHGGGDVHLVYVGHLRVYSSESEKHQHSTSTIWRQRLLWSDFLSARFSYGRNSGQRTGVRRPPGPAPLRAGACGLALGPCRHRLVCK